MMNIIRWPKTPHKNVQNMTALMLPKKPEEQDIVISSLWFALAYQYGKRGKRAA
jgi:hypothetical protein